MPSLYCESGSSAGCAGRYDYPDEADEKKDDIHYR